MKTLLRMARIAGVVWIAVGLLLTTSAQPGPTGIVRTTPRADYLAGLAGLETPVGMAALSMGVLTVALANHQLLKIRVADLEKRLGSSTSVRQS